MQHDYVLKKTVFWPFVPIIRSQGGSLEGGRIICFHVVATVIPLNLMCNMTMF